MARVKESEGLSESEAKRIGREEQQLALKTHLLARSPRDDGALYSVSAES